MGPFQAVLFDMDGLIFDSERLCYKAYLRAARAFGFQMNPALYMSLCGRIEHEVVAGLRHAFGEDKDVATWREYIKKQKTAVRMEQNGRVGKKKGLLELLSYLQERQIPYALASSSVRPLIDEYMKAEYLTHAFPYIMDGTQVENGSPTPRSSSRRPRSSTPTLRTRSCSRTAMRACSPPTPAASRRASSSTT